MLDIKALVLRMALFSHGLALCHARSCSTPFDDNFTEAFFVGTPCSYSMLNSGDSRSCLEDQLGELRQQLAEASVDLMLADLVWEANWTCFAGPDGRPLVTERMTCRHPEYDHANPTESRQILLNISMLQPIYSRALQVGGVRGVIDLLDAGQYVNHTRGVLLHRGKRENVDFAVRISRMAHLAVSTVMTSSFYPRLSSVAECVPGCTMDPFHRTGGLWWIRHWSGEFLQRQAVERDIELERLVWYLQLQQNCGPDFTPIAQSHAVAYATFAAPSTCHALSPLQCKLQLGYPTERMHEWCDRASGVVHGKNSRTECWHAIGHGMFYAAVGAGYPELMSGYRAGYTLRPRSLDVRPEVVEAALQLCLKAPGGADKYCVNGMAHSYSLISRLKNQTVLKTVRAHDAFQTKYNWGK